MSREDRNEMLRARMREAAEYIEDMPRFSSKNTPEVTKAYLRLLGEPAAYAIIWNPSAWRPVIPRAFSFPPICRISGNVCA